MLWDKLHVILDHQMIQCIQCVCMCVSARTPSFNSVFFIRAKSAQELVLMAADQIKKPRSQSSVTTSTLREPAPECKVRIAFDNRHIHGPFISHVGEACVFLQFPVQN